MFNLTKDSTSAHVAYGDTPLFTYCFTPDTPQVEFNRPFLHPIRTLSGEVLTDERAADHVWHKGLSMTLTVVNDQNFWGGKTYVHGEGYVPKDNVGATIHREWLVDPHPQPLSRLRERGENADEVALTDEVGSDKADGIYVPTGVTLAHRLDWVTAQGETWLNEERTLRCCEVWQDAGCWSLTWRSKLENVSGIDLSIGSPTTKGRKAAGYGGLFWRGSPDMLDGAVMADGDLCGEDAVNGAKARWISYSRAAGDGQRKPTVILRDHADNPRYPTPWFVRSTQYPGISAALAYHIPYILASGETLDLRYRLIVLDDAWTREDVSRVVNTLT